MSSWSNLSPPSSLFSDSELYSPFTLEPMREEEEEERRAFEWWRKKEKGLTDSEIEEVEREREKKKRRKEKEEGEGGLPWDRPPQPPQSRVYEYGASESSNEPYSDDPGPDGADIAPIDAQIPPMGEANVVMEDDTPPASDDDSLIDMEEDADSNDSDSESDSDDSDESMVLA